jgi:hypothetical protein
MENNMNDKFAILRDEINNLTRQELVSAKIELTVDKDLPRKEKGKIMAAIDFRLGQLKNSEKSPVDTSKNYSLISMERDGEKLSALTTKTLGEVVLNMEPDVVYGFYKISKKEFEELRELGYGEVY